jgi:alpha-ketoglutarate-dependent taurine dioxygenase
MALEDFGLITRNLPIASEDKLIAGTWVADAKTILQDQGAVLLRGPVTRHDAAEIALSKLDGELLEDAFWSTPRSKVGGKTLTATEYPSPRTIPLHSEMAYMRSWPRLVCFHAIEVAETGGETTICNIDRVSARLGNRLKPFRDKGVMYRRTFQKRVDIAWQNAFQTENRNDVEDIGRRSGMKIDWLPNDVLQTTHTAQGTIAAEDGQPIYFNQTHLFHPSALDKPVRQALEKAYGADRLPRQAAYGDGSPIAEADLDTVRDAFAACQTKMCWRAGDILILDNLRYAHGRLPFTGARRLHVSLARLTTGPKRTALFAPEFAAT